MFIDLLSEKQPYFFSLEKMQLLSTDCTKQESTLRYEWKRKNESKIEASIKMENLNITYLRIYPGLIRGTFKINEQNT